MPKAGNCLRFHGNGAARSVDAPAPEMSPAVAGQSVTDLNRKVGANSPAQMIAVRRSAAQVTKPRRKQQPMHRSVFTDATLGVPTALCPPSSDSRHPRRRRHARYRWIRRRHQLASARDDEHGAVIRHRLTVRSVAENTAAGRPIGSPVTATDPDPGETLVYRLEGTDSDAFDLVPATGQLRTRAPLNHEAMPSHSVVIVAEDSQGATTRVQVTIAVTDQPRTATGAGCTDRRVGGGFRYQIRQKPGVCTGRRRRTRGSLPSRATTYASSRERNPGGSTVRRTIPTPPRGSSA